MRETQYIANAPDCLGVSIRRSTGLVAGLTGTKKASSPWRHNRRAAGFRLFCSCFPLEAHRCPSLNPHIVQDDLALGGGFYLLLPCPFSRVWGGVSIG